MRKFIAAGLAACALGVGATQASADPVSGWGLLATPDAATEPIYCQFQANGHYAGTPTAPVAFQVRLLQGGSQLGSIATYDLRPAGVYRNGNGKSGPWIGGAPAGYYYTTQVRVWNYATQTGTVWGQGLSAISQHAC